MAKAAREALAKYKLEHPEASDRDIDIESMLPAAPANALPVQPPPGVGVPGPAGLRFAVGGPAVPAIPAGAGRAVPAPAPPAAVHPPQRNHRAAAREAARQEVARRDDAKREAARVREMQRAANAHRQQQNRMIEEQVRRNAVHFVFHDARDFQLVTILYCS